MNKYKKCRYKGKRMTKHRAWFVGVVESFGWSKEETSEYISRMVVHHINGDKGDNSVSNLRIMTDRLHKKLHAQKQKRNKGRFAK